MSRKFHLLFFILTLIFPVSYAQSIDKSERVIRFDSFILINKDASLDVTENILVYANERKILHGIIRRLPGQYDYQIKQVVVDGKPSAYHIETRNKLYVIYIGNLDTMLPTGTYTYTLRYRVKNVVRFLSNADELIWNVTGYDWDYPILATHLELALPKGTAFSRYGVYTGFPYEKGTAFSLHQSAPNQITFSTNQPLSPGQALRIAVSWPKGIVQLPAPSSHIKRAPLWVRYLILIVVIVVLLGAWRICKRKKA